MLEIRCLPDKTRFHGLVGFARPTVDVDVGFHAIATAILDRLLYHATTLNIKGESFRLKEKRKAGLITQPIEKSKGEN